MADQLTARMQVVTDGGSVPADQLSGRIALFDQFGNIINPMNRNGGVDAVVIVTQAQYDALDPPGPNTLYVIRG